MHIHIHRKRGSHNKPNRVCVPATSVIQRGTDKKKGNEKKQKCICICIRMCVKEKGR